MQFIMARHDGNRRSGEHGDLADLAGMDEPQTAFEGRASGSGASVDF